MTRVRVTVTVLEMGATMTATGAAEEIWCVAQITARSLVTTIMKRTIAARNHDQIEFLIREDSESLLRKVYMYWIFLIMLQ